MKIEGVKITNKLMDFISKEDGSVVEYQGRQKATFLSEFKARTMANGIVTFLKGFPGFSEFWFTQEYAKRDNIFREIQIRILNDLPNTTGSSMERCRAMCNSLVSYFDGLAGFTAWREVVLGTTLKERIKYQLTQYLYNEYKKVR